MRERKDFWDRNAGLYDRFMRKDGAAYRSCLRLLRLRTGNRNVRCLFRERSHGKLYLRLCARGTAGRLSAHHQRAGQGYMRKVLDIAFAEGDRLGVPVILETDAKSKCDKYVHLGMELAGTHDLGAFGKLYDLIRYPESSNETGTT